MFRDDIQLAQVCRALVSTVNLQRLWTDDGPTDEALATLAGGVPLSSGEILIVRVAWDVWNGQGSVRLKELLGILDPRKLAVVGALLRSIASGPNAIDAWLATMRG